MKTLCDAKIRKMKREVHMTKSQKDYLYCFLLMVLVCSGMAGGGYFCYVSAVASVVLMAAVVVFLVRTGGFRISFDWNLVAIVILAFGYFAACLWAVDSGMALMGGVKFLPVFLYFFLMCQAVEQRERLIRFLPVLGSMMTLFSFVMMQFPVFSPYVSVAGRLAGFFQYPNTYALFLLVCLLVSIYQIHLEHVDWMLVVHMLAALVGIYLSGSRTVMALAVATIFLLFLFKKELRKYAVLCVGIFLIMVMILAVCGFGEGIYRRLLVLAGNASTFWGRLLYDRDALQIIAAHPFGMGYYGYYFVQQEMQTGVYSVVNVHNEFLQIMLDIGIIPAILMYGSIVRSILSKNIPERNRVILLVMFLHSLFDYDFQFLALYFVLLLFLDVENIKKVKISVLTKGTAVAAFAVLIVLSGVVGTSEFLYINRKSEAAVRIYNGNTLAKLDLLSQAEEAGELEALADSILEGNGHVSVAYSAKARVAFARGDVQAFVQNKLMAIRLAPYRHEEYLDYLAALVYSVKLYREAGDEESARFCVERAKEIPRMLEEVKKRTSRLAWIINDRPEVTLSRENMELIEEMK